MQLIAYASESGREMGVVRGETVVGVSSVEAFYADTEAGLARAAAASGEGRPLSSLELVPFVPETSRVICVGLNYKMHAQEASQKLPSVPNLFARWASTLVTNGEKIPLPPGEGRLDWEGELGVVIGRRVSAADTEGAAAAILGYTCFNDLSARQYQMAASQWTLGKNADASGPMGPVLVTADDIADPYALHLETRVNGNVMQSSSTGEMIFRAPEVISYASGAMTLLPGDVIATGTPEGVGFTRNPPVFLASGDVVEIEISSIGVLRNLIA